MKRDTCQLLVKVTILTILPENGCLSTQPEINKPQTRERQGKERRNSQDPLSASESEWEESRQILAVRDEQRTSRRPWDDDVISLIQIDEAAYLLSLIL